MTLHKDRNPLTRREALRRVGNGFGMMAFAGMLGNSLAQANSIVNDANMRSAKLDHPQRVKRVIFLFMNGGCSSIDSFDPKPALAKYDGQPMPGGEIKTERKTRRTDEVAVHVQEVRTCGMDVSELWPHLGEVADDICWIRSVYTEIPNHEPACLMMNTGEPGGTSVSGFVDDLRAGHGEPESAGLCGVVSGHPTTVGPPLWSNGFLPAINQGTYISNKVETPEVRTAMDEMMARRQRRPEGQESRRRSLSRRASIRRN